MIALKVDFDPGKLFERQLSDLERSQIPDATSQAINKMAAAIHYKWRDIAPKVFKNPVQLTRTAALYKKGGKAKPEATIYIRDEASNGVAPAKYLQAQVFGGERKYKGIERELSARGVLPAGMFVVPGQGAKLDAHGNIPRSQINALKSQLSLHNDKYTNQTDVSKTRRQKRQAKKGERRGDYFAVSKVRAGLKPGVYQRVKTGFGRGVASIMHFVRRVSYRKRYDIYQMAETVFKRQFPEIFKNEFEKAIDSAFRKGFK